MRRRFVPSDTKAGSTPHARGTLRFEEKARCCRNDDHPGYSDAQISEALLADEVNAIAKSPYWKNSVIIITYDETDGMYDHVPPQIRIKDAGGLPLEAG